MADEPEACEAMAEIETNAEICVEDKKLLTVTTPRCQDESGDWKYNENLLWFTKTPNIDGVTDNYEGENATEWKYKNLYSMSERNAAAASSWNLCRGAPVAPLSTATFRKRSDMTTSKERNFLITIREYLANYQESYGVPKSEYSFAALIKVMGQATGRSLLALIYIVVNITPIAQILVHILRFVLDKIMSIQNTNDIRQMIVKYTILGLQLICVYVCLVFIFGFIVMPVLSMAIGIFMKIVMYD